MMERSDNVGTEKEVRGIYRQGAQRGVLNKEVDRHHENAVGATASRAINGSLEVRVGGKSAELGTLAPIHD